jgi:hypothetical protein
MDGNKLIDNFYLIQNEFEKLDFLKLDTFLF